MWGEYTKCLNKSTVCCRLQNAPRLPGKQVHMLLKSDLYILEGHRSLFQTRQSFTDDVLVQSCTGKMHCLNGSILSLWTVWIILIVHSDFQSQLNIKFFLKYNITIWLQHTPLGLICSMSKKVTLFFIHKMLDFYMKWLIPLRKQIFLPLNPGVNIRHNSMIVNHKYIFNSGFWHCPFFCKMV